MSKIKDIIYSMGEIVDIEEGGQLIKCRCNIKCGNCSKINDVSVDAIYRQHKRGNDKYLCRSCASKAAWTSNKKDEARARTKEKWDDPDYSGTIDGKALARSIIKELE